MTRLDAKDKKISELEGLVATVARGKYMWESTFDAITSPVIIISSSFQILRANQAAAQAAKMDVRHMIGTLCYQSLAGCDQSCQGCPVNQTVLQKQSHFYSLDPFKKNGRQYEVHAYLLKSDENQVVLHYRDITEEKELQRRLMQTEKMAAIGMLAGGVAHEINNPLGGILAFAQLAMREIPQEHAAYGDLKEIEEAALRCKKIVQDLLDFSRQSKDDVMVPVVVNEVIKKMLPLIQVQARSSRIDLQCELDETIPPLLGNFHKLQQVFLNLVTNAYHAMSKQQGGRLFIRTTLDPAKKIRVEVIDSGPGISKKIIGKIFDPYFTTKAQGEGTGLGLAITYGLVKEHGGGIEVISQEGQGTTFILTFDPLES